jgi:hypothetical protein
LNFEGWTYNLLYGFNYIINVFFHIRQNYNGLIIMSLPTIKFKYIDIVCAFCHVAKSLMELLLLRLIYNFGPKDFTTIKTRGWQIENKLLQCKHNRGKRLSSRRWSYLESKINKKFQGCKLL